MYTRVAFTSCIHELLVVAVAMVVVAMVMVAMVMLILKTLPTSLAQCVCQSTHTALIAFFLA